MSDDEPFRKHVRDQTGPRGTQRRADGRLTHTVGRARQQQVRDIGAGDQEHKTNRREQGPEQLDSVTAHLRGRHRHQAEVPIPA
jgi:hypothetical protein